MAKKVNTIYSGSEKKNPNALLLLIIAVLLITAIVLFSILMSNIFGKEHLASHQGGGKLVNTRTGVTYTMITPNPYAVDLDKDVYAECNGTRYYRIAYTDANGNRQLYDPLKMIATKNDGALEIYLAQGFTLPQFEQLNLTYGIVYFSGKTQILDFYLTKKDTAIVMNEIKNGQSVVAPANTEINADSIRILRLADESYNHFQYNITYFATKSGESYLQDKVSGFCIKATSGLDPVFKAEVIE